MRNHAKSVGAFVVCGMLGCGVAQASPVMVSFGDLPNCDPMIFGPPVLDELGTATPPFPVACSIFASSQPTTQSACPTSDVPGVANVELRMVNLTGRDFSDVWYAGENGTGFTNFDGIINGVEAFKIDSIGGNRPLVAESATANGIWEAGEAWTVVIDDWTNTFGFLPEDFVSLGVPSGGAAAGSASSGSIVALEVPGPGALALAGVGGLMALRRRRRS